MSWLPGRRTKVIVAADGRVWVLRRRRRWRSPDKAAEYEHEVGSGGGELAILGFLAAFWVVVVYLFFVGRVHIPWYFGIIIFAAGAVVVAGWVARRSWMVTAESAQPAERWAGVARGGGAARSEMFTMERGLKTYSSPHRSEGPLTRITDSAVRQPDQ